MTVDDAPARPLVVVAVDLGAESARVVGVAFDGERLTAREVRRTGHAPSRVDGVLRWDVDALWATTAAGLAELAAESPVASVGVDAWGVDYGLLDASGALLDRPTCYRDPRQVAPMTEALEHLGRERLFTATGCAVSEITTLFALMDDARTGRLERAAQLLMLPDVLHHRLSGARTTELTAASTTGVWDVAGGRWAAELAEELGVPSRLLPEVVAPGTPLGAVVGELGTGPLRGTRVVAPAAHDTASAVAATPFTEPGALFLSSGTWSLAGVERDGAVVTPRALAAGLTNEAGAGGAVHLLRNVMGLWLLQECRRTWAAQGLDLSYADLAAMAAAQPALRSVVNPNAPEFLAPGDVPARVREHCRRSGEPVPETPAAVARCVVDSLALLYAAVVEDLAAVTGEAVPAVHVTGGGSRHEVLAQATADATGLTVHCGPVEATALGNAGVQLVATGELASPADVREAVARTTRPRTFAPRPDERWAEGLARLRRLAEADEHRRGLVGT